MAGKRKERNKRLKLNTAVNKVKAVHKDNRALMTAPIVLMLCVFFMMTTMYVAQRFVIVANAAALKQEILAETSYFNAAIADAMYKNMSEGNHGKLGTATNGSSSSIARQLVNEEKEKFKARLIKDLKIITKWEDYNSDTRYFIGSMSIRITDVDTETSTVSYSIELYNVYKVNVGEQMSDYNTYGGVIYVGRFVEVYASYTYNGDEDVADNEGTVVFDNSKVTTTKPSSDEVEERLNTLPQDENDDNLID